VCFTCPDEEGAADCSGGILRLRDGYYLTPGTAEVVDEVTGEVRPTAESELRMCPNREVCNVDAVNRLFSCDFGYTGPLCAQCDAEVDYAQETLFACIPCRPTWVNWLLVSMVVVLGLGGLIYVAVIRRPNAHYEFGLVFRIMLNYLQSLATLSQFAARGTRLFLEVFKFASMLGVGVAVASPTQCIYPMDFYVTYYAMLASPFIVAAMAVTLNFMVIAIREKNRCKTMYDFVVNGEYWRAVIIVMFFTYSSLTSTAFSI